MAESRQTFSHIASNQQEKRPNSKSTCGMIVPTRLFGWTGIKIAVLGQGTWLIEGDREHERRAVESLRVGLDLGMTHIDTAELYGNGHVEKLVSEAIAGRREQVFLTSKVMPSNASYNGTVVACEQSLRRLKTDWLDLYLLHWPGSHPIAQTMRAMEELVDRGLIRFFGLSNFDVRELQQAERSLKKHAIACNQVHYHLTKRGIERKLISYCKQQRIAVVGYSPFGYVKSLSPRTRAVLKAIAEKHGTTSRQVALNFLTRDPDVFAIPRATKPEHVRENAGGRGWSLEAEDIAAIDRAFPAPDHDVPLSIV